MVGIRGQVDLGVGGGLWRREPPEPVCPPCAPVAIQALRSVLNAFSVVNRKNMFVYQERATKAVYYLR